MLAHLNCWLIVAVTANCCSFFGVIVSPFQLVKIQLGMLFDTRHMDVISAASIWKDCWKLSSDARQNLKNFTLLTLSMQEWYLYKFLIWFIGLKQRCRVVQAFFLLSMRANPRTQVWEIAVYWVYKAWISLLELCQELRVQQNCLGRGNGLEKVTDLRANQEAEVCLRHLIRCRINSA